MTTPVADVATRHPAGNALSHALGRCTEQLGDASERPRRLPRTAPPQRATRPSTQEQRGDNTMPDNTTAEMKREMEREYEARQAHSRAAEPLVWDRLFELDNSLERLHVELSVIADRLSAVMRADAEDTKAMPAVLEVSTSTLAARIDDAIRRADAAQSRLHSLIERLDV